jgi:hypothetical protein
MQKSFVVAILSAIALSTSAMAQSVAAGTWTKVSLDGAQYAIPPGTQILLPPPSGGFIAGPDLQAAVDRNRNAAKDDPNITHHGLFMSTAASNKPAVALFDLEGLKDSAEMKAVMSAAGKGDYVDEVARLADVSPSPETSVYAIRTGVSSAPLAIASCIEPASEGPACDVTVDISHTRRLRILGLQVVKADDSTAVRRSIMDIIPVVLPGRV